MPTIYVVRHGQDEDNAAGILNGHRDRPLTELGRAQARAAAVTFVERSITTIYTSPLQRARQTATIIAEHLGIAPVVPLPELVERDFGILTGKPSVDIPRYSSKTLQSDHVLYFLEGEGVEQFPNVYERAQRILLKMRDLHPHEHIMLVTHGDTGKMLWAAHHGVHWRSGLAQPHFVNAGVLELL